MSSLTQKIHDLANRINTAVFALQFLDERSDLSADPEMEQHLLALKKKVQAASDVVREMQLTARAAEQTADKTPRESSVKEPQSAPLLKLLIVDDEPVTVNQLKEVLARPELDLLTSTDPEVALALCREQRPQLVIADIKMPGMSGMELLERAIQHDPGIQVILITGHYTTETAIEAIKKGAVDFLTKPLDVEQLRARVGQLIAEAARRKHALELERELIHTYQFQNIVGRSPLMLDVFAAIRRVAPHFRTALVTGETGTGKERVAQALHRLSPAGSRTFAVCNCSALTETLYESELFGYVRGAFTGATQDKIGLFEYAQGGTVFLDEIGDLPLSGQAKLLRVLQNQEIQRVGSPATKRIDVRVVAATNRDLRSLVKEKLFREDLFYRLSMIEIRLPRLAERPEDLPLLQRHFIEQFAAQFNKPIRGMTRRTQQLLARYPWPGNVRELENVIGNACMMMTTSDVIDIPDLPSYIRTPLERGTADEEAVSIEEVQRRHVLKTIERVGGNKVRAADILGISRTTLYNILKSEGPS